MDRLIALVGLRFKLTLRAYLRARESLAGLLLALPFMALFSLVTAIVVFLTTRGLARQGPDAVAPVLSALVTIVGLGWSFSPLLSGAAVSEGHDLARLSHYPVSPRWLVGSSLLAHFFEPSLWSLALPSFALAVALSQHAVLVILSMTGVGLTLIFTVIMAQGAALIFEWLAQRRKWHDRLLVVGIAAGILMSLAPVWLLIGGLRALSAVLRLIVVTDVFMLSPFAWGVRAAAHGGRAEYLPFLLYGVLALCACMVGFAGTLGLMSILTTSRVSLTGARHGRGNTRPAHFLPGVTGAVISKDLRMIWRNPSLKTALFMGLIAPIVLLIWMGRTVGSEQSLGPPFFLALVVGLAPVGLHTFGIERRGIQLLMSFPASRFKILVGKNVATLVMRLPGLALVALASALMAPLIIVAPALTSAVILLLLSAAAENYLSIWFPITLPAPGRSPHARLAGGRGLGVFMLTSLVVGLVLVLAAPFVFLAWLPILMELPWLLALGIPLSVAGAAATYVALVAGAAGVLSRREQRLLERILGDA